MLAPGEWTAVLYTEQAPSEPQTRGTSRMVAGRGHASPRGSWAVRGHRGCQRAGGAVSWKNTVTSSTGETWCSDMARSAVLRTQEAPTSQLLEGEEAFSLVCCTRRPSVRTRGSGSSDKPGNTGHLGGQARASPRRMRWGGGGCRRLCVRVPPKATLLASQSRASAHMHKSSQKVPEEAWGGRGSCHPQGVLAPSAMGL